MIDPANSNALNHFCFYMTFARVAHREMHKRMKKKNKWKIQQPKLKKKNTFQQIVFNCKAPGISITRARTIQIHVFRCNSNEYLSVEWKKKYIYILFSYILNELNWKLMPMENLMALQVVCAMRNALTKPTNMIIRDQWDNDRN